MGMITIQVNKMLHSRIRIRNTGYNNQSLVVANTVMQERKYFIIFLPLCPSRNSVILHEQGTPDLVP